MANNCVIECNTEEVEKLAKEIELIAKNLHWSIERLKVHGIKVTYHCDTTELDKRIENIIKDSIKIVDAR